MQPTQINQQEHDLISNQTYEFIANGGVITKALKKSTKEIIMECRESFKRNAKKLGYS